MIEEPYEEYDDCPDPSDECLHMLKVMNKSSSPTAKAIASLSAAVWYMAAIQDGMNKRP